MMKKRILSILILALTVSSVFAFASCGKKEEIGCPNCDGNLENIENYYFCDKGETHSFDICVNEDCKAPIDNSNGLYCSSCGESQFVCPACEDVEKVEGTYCHLCGKQVLRDGKIKLKFDIDALGQSAMILCKGMLGIFIVTGVIITFILVLNTIVEKINQARENKDK